MNILILSWRGPGHPNAGGAEISTHEHAKNWVRAGNSVTLFTSSFKDGKSEEVIDGIIITRRGSDVFGVQLSAFVWYFLGRHERFDLVVDQFHGIPFFTPLYVRTKKLAFIHEVTKEVWWLNPWQKPFNLIPGIVGTLFEPLIFKFFYRHTSFMTVSESTKKDLIGWDIPRHNISVVHNGITTLKVRLINKKEKTLIYLGALTKDKGIEDAIKVFDLINQKDPNWQFWVVGKGESKYISNLKMKIKEFNLNKKIRFFGYIDQNKKFELLAKAQVLINPSVREGWGLVNIEANSVGTPVLGYNVPGMTDSVQIGRTGYLLDKGDVSNMAQKVLNLSRDNKIYNKLSRESVWWSKKFTWDKSGKMSLELINNL